MKNSELIIDNRYTIEEDISNTSLKKLCNFYNTFYNKNNKKRTIEKLQYILNVRQKKDKHKRIAQKQECAICYEVLTENNILVTRCMHAYCDHCIVNYLRLYAQSCPICRHYCAVDMFVFDNHIDLLRMMELSPENALEQIINNDNDNDNEDDNEDEEEQDNNGYFIFEYILQNYHIYDRIIFIGFLLYTLHYFCMVLYLLFRSQ